MTSDTDRILELERTVQTLKDRQEIADCLTRYARGIDRLDRELILSAFHPDAIDDHGQFLGGPEEFATWAIEMQLDINLMHQHCLHQQSCEIDGDTAHAETYFLVLALNRDGRPWTMTAGRYIDRLERRQGNWAIAHRVMVRDWAVVDELLDEQGLLTLTAFGQRPEPVQAFMRGGPLPRRDKDDPSYSRELKVSPARLAAWHSLSSDELGLSSPR